MSRATARKAEVSPLLEAVAESHLRRVYNFCLAFLKNPSDAEDACQETFLAVARHREDLGEIRQIGPWVTKVALRSCLWLLRKRARAAHADLREDAEAAPGAGPPVGASEDAGRIREAIDRLPDRYRLVLILKYQQGMGHDEIAETMDLSQGAFRVLLHRAVAKLREEVSRRP